MDAEVKEGERTHPQLSGKLSWKKIVLLVMEIFEGQCPLAKLKGCQMKSMTKTPTSWDAKLKGSIDSSLATLSFSCGTYINHS